MVAGLSWFSLGEGGGLGIGWERVVGLVPLVRMTSGLLGGVVFLFEQRDGSNQVVCPPKRHSLVS